MIVTLDIFLWFGRRDSALDEMAKERGGIIQEVLVAMKAVLLTGHGGPEKLEYREDVPTPEPAEGEVLIEVGAAGVNNTDIWTREGAYGTEDDPEAVGGWRRGKAMAFPRIQGLDIAGRIVVVGDGVPESRIGERVLVDFVLRSGVGEEGLVDADLIGSERDGGFAEYVAAPAENACAIETSLTQAHGPLRDRGGHRRRGRASRPQDPLS
jgi:NADPH:quinone reductase-like Zn-dependent oxidoreductase